MAGNGSWGQEKVLVLRGDGFVEGGMRMGLGTSGGCVEKQEWVGLGWKWVEPLGAWREEKCEGVRECDVWALCLYCWELNFYFKEFLLLY